MWQSRLSDAEVWFFCNAIWRCRTPTATDLKSDHASHSLIAKTCLPYLPCCLLFWFIIDCCCHGEIQKGRNEYQNVCCFSYIPGSFYPSTFIRVRLCICSPISIQIVSVWHHIFTISILGVARPTATLITISSDWHYPRAVSPFSRAKWSRPFYRSFPHRAIIRNPPAKTIFFSTTY